MDFRKVKYSKMKEQLRDLRNKIRRMKLTNCEFTIIANNCLAGCVLHDFKLRFDTPTINLYIPFPDYMFFLKNLKQIVYAEFVQLPSENSHPVGLLGGGSACLFSSLSDV